MTNSTTEDEYTTDDGADKPYQRPENNWYTRNDSSNVSAILNLELHNSGYDGNFLNPLKKPFVVSNHCYKTGRTPKYYCDDCYCRRSPVYPKLKLKLLEQNKKLKAPKCRQLQQKCCLHDWQYNYEKYGASFQNSSPEKNQTEKMLPITPSLHYTTPRKAYEEFEAPVAPSKDFTREQPQLDEAPKSEKSNQRKKQISDLGKKRKVTKLQNNEYIISPVLTTILENEKQESLNLNAFDNASVDKISATNRGLKKLSTFRKENYFDCHSTGNLSDWKPEEHRCVHKFVLNNRLIPQPLHADSFGTSRCTICYKPIESAIANKNNAVTKEKTNYQTNVLRKSARGDHQPKSKINIGSNKNDRIEIKVPLSFDKYNELFHTCYKIKNPISANSLALRHQKGVVQAFV